jgi:tRNA-dihydrouridine synthase B
MLKLGKYNIDNFPVGLAPMEDISDPPFRYLCSKYNADYFVTEFISSDGLVREVEKSLKKAELKDYERPIGIQIFGNNPETMARAAQVAENMNPDFIDLNFGCPVKKIAGKGAGAGLLNNVPLLLEITENVVKAVNVPVTVKTRLGWDEKNKNILDITKHLQDLGIHSITIHGRTKKQMYKGEADWTLIGEVKNHPDIHIPVIGNGDVTSPEIAKEKFSTYNVDGIMVGRAAIGKPWIFKQIKHYLTTGEIISEPLLNEKVQLAKEHLIKSIEWKGEKSGVLEMRRHFSNYFKSLPNFKPIRMNLVTELDPKILLEILDEIPTLYPEY